MRVKAQPSSPWTLSSFYPSFNDNGSNRSREGFNVQPCSSEQIPSRPWRGQKYGRNNQLGNNFLDKFKLGFDNKTMNPSEVATSNQYEEAKRSDPSQTTPESAPQDAYEIFKKMKETGLIPNSVAMLDGLCKDMFKKP
ncbi:hypothetical protein SESBI_18250 [Sesbania bispinosa]|nr:hypothetical protein SESBI_18250 [Sesbania bispinosa]